MFSIPIKSIDSVMYSCSFIYCLILFIFQNYSKHDHIYDFEIRLDQTLLLTLRDEARWAIKNKLVSKAILPDFYNYIAADILQEIDPHAVSIRQ